MTTVNRLIELLSDLPGEAPVIFVADMPCCRFDLELLSVYQAGQDVAIDFRGIPDDGEDL